MTERLKGKVAFVTGGSSGIGAATAERFAEEGATVVICGRHQDTLDKVVDRITAAGGKAESLQADVSVEAEIVNALEATAKKHGRLDVLVNNAVAFTYGPLEDTTTEDWRTNFLTTVDGTFWATRTALKLMKTQGGSIVNLGSICGTFGAAYMAGYSAAKAAIVNFSRAAAAEGAASGIRVNVVIPGVVETPATAGMLTDEKMRQGTQKLIPLGRVGDPVELANAILFFASDESSYVTGAALPVDGGNAAVLKTAL